MNFMTENNGQRVSTVLITGGSGLIGRHLTSLLLRKAIMFLIYHGMKHIMIK